MKMLWLFFRNMKVLIEVYLWWQMLIWSAWETESMGVNAVEYVEDDPHDILIWSFSFNTCVNQEHLTCSPPLKGSFNVIRWHLKPSTDTCHRFRQKVRPDAILMCEEIVRRARDALHLHISIYSSERLQNVLECTL